MNTKRSLALTAIVAASFALILFGPVWTTIRFADVFGRFLWMQSAYDEPHYFWQLYQQIANGALDINYRLFSKLLGMLLQSAGASFDSMVTAYAIVDPVLAFAGALFLAATWEKHSVARVVWALLVVLSFDLLSGSNFLVDYEPPAGWLAGLFNNPALLKPDGVNFFMIHRRPEPQSSWIILFPYFAALLRSFLTDRRTLYLWVCMATPALALVYINVAVVALMVFVQLSILGAIVYRRPIVLPFALTIAATALAFGLTFVSGSTPVIAAQSTIHTHLAILRPSIAMALGGLVWTGLRLRRDGMSPSCLAALVFFAVPLITLNQQIVTGMTVMPQNWEFNVNYICLVVGAGLMSANFLSSFEERADWRRFAPLGVWAVIAFAVVRGELRNEEQYIADNARSVVFAELVAEAKSKVGHVDAVILPHLFDESLFITRTPRGTPVLGGYSWLILNQPPIWSSSESFEQHAKAANASFSIGFETLFRTGVTVEQLRQGMQTEISRGNCWPSLMYFFSLNDCWPAFLNYTSPASRRLADAIPPLVALYGKYLEDEADHALARKRVLVIRTQALPQGTPSAIENELVASAEVDVHGTPVRAYAYLQRQKHR